MEVCGNRVKISAFYGISYRLFAQPVESLWLLDALTATKSTTASRLGMAFSFGESVFFARGAERTEYSITVLCGPMLRDQVSMSDKPCSHLLRLELSGKPTFQGFTRTHFSMWLLWLSQAQRNPGVEPATWNAFQELTVRVYERFKCRRTANGTCDYVTKGAPGIAF
jgi:hypothetical protein